MIYRNFQIQIWQIKNVDNIYKVTTTSLLYYFQLVENKMLFNGQDKTIPLNTIA